MNLGISNKFLINKIRHNFHRFFSIKQNLGKCSNANCSNIFYYPNAKNFSSIPFSKHFFQKNLYNTSRIVSIQRRNVSNDISDIESSSKATTDLMPIEEAINMTVASVPNIVKQMADWKIVEMAQQILLKVHETTGLPWWASIALTAFIARTTVTLPLTIIQIKTAAKLEMIKLEIDEIANKLKAEAYYRYNKQHWPEDLVKRDLKRKIKTEMKNLIIRDNCHPAKCYILVFIQIPLWIAFSCAIRNLCFMLPTPDFMAQITHMELTVGGFGWITNLVDVDHYMILPLILGLLNLAVLEVHQLFRISQPSKYEKWIRNFFRIFIIATIPIATYLPTAINFYWISSSAYGIIQAFLINSTRLRRLFRIPIVKSELEKPYQQFYNNFKAKLTYK